jgi:hypothetical protein
MGSSPGAMRQTAAGLRLCTGTYAGEHHSCLTRRASRVAPYIRSYCRRPDGRQCSDEFREVKNAAQTSFSGRRQSKKRPGMSRVSGPIRALRLAVRRRPGDLSAYRLTRSWAD